MSLTFRNPTIGKEISFLVYIAGVEIPCQSISVSAGQSRFPQFSLDVPPDPLLYRLGADDRVPVAVFYLDLFAYENPTYCLLCEGEITGWSYNRTGQSRSMSLACVDPLAVMTQLFIHFILDIDPALNNTSQIRKQSAAGNVVTMNTLPLAFFYQFLSPQGQGAEAVKRPVDILLNIFASITGYSKSIGIPVYSKRKRLLGAVTAAQKAALSAKNVKGIDIYSAANKVVDIGKSSPNTGGTPKKGPREFSPAGLVAYAAETNTLTIPSFSQPQDIYNYCQQQNTLQAADVIANIPGALVFESATNSASNVTNVGIIAPGGQVIEVIPNNRQTSGDDGFRKVHDYTAVRHESRGIPGKFTQDVTGKGEPAGLAVGLIQHNQKYGTLYEICREMLRTNGTKFENLMGGELGIDMFTGTKGGFKKYNFQDPAQLSYWSDRFSATFSDPEFIQVQYDFDKRYYFAPAFALAQKYKIDNEVGATLVFDAYVQIGARSTKNILTRVESELGANARRQKFMERFAYYADRQGKPPGQAFTRRNRILNDPTLNADIKIEASNVPVTIQPGVRRIALVQSWRKPVGYGLLPGVDYSEALPAGVDPPQSKQAKDDKGRRLVDLRRKKQEQILETARSIFGFRENNNYSSREIERATQEWAERNAEAYAKQLNSAKRSAKANTTGARALQRAKIAILFFMRWLQKTKTREHVVASPFLEDNFKGSGKSNGIFPVLSAMKNENAAIAIAQYNQQGGSRGGSMWQFLQNTFQIALWDLAMITSPPSVVINENHVIQKRYTQGVSGDQAIASYISKPLNYFGLPPSCNVYFPSMYTSLNFRENYATQPTRTYLDDSTTAKMLGMSQRSVFSYFASAKAAYPGEVDNKLFQEKKKNSPKNPKDLVVYPEELYKGPVTNRRATPTWFYFLYKQFTNRKASQDQSKRENPPTEILPKARGLDVVYKRGSQSFQLPYVDDRRVTSTSTVFSQQGYFRGLPVRFNAVNIDGKVLHEKAGADFSRLRVDAAKQGITLTVKEGFVTAGEQAAKATDKNSEIPGRSLSQAGAKIKLGVLVKDVEKTEKFIRQNAARFGFVVGADNRTLISRSAKASLAKQRQAVSDNIKGAGSDTDKRARRVQTSLGQYVLDIVKAKNGARTSNLQSREDHITYFKYAKYEHFREKYSSRTVAVTGVFNPYVVPNFPIFVFDKDRTNFLLVGHVVQVSHSISHAGQATTTIQLTHVRTFEEMFELVNLESSGFPVSPVDPIREVSDRMQKFKEARDYYERLFYGGETFRGKDPLADYQKLIGYANNGAEPDRIYADATDTDRYNLNTNFDRELAPLPSARNLFENTNNALRYCARPVTTIEDYIDFYSGVRRLSSFPGDKIEHNSAFDKRFYYQIREFDYGEGLNEKNDPTAVGITEAESYARVNKLPPTLRDWQRVLLLYRQKIYANQTDV